MSLVQGQVCCAVSFGVVLDETGAVQDYSIHTSLIKPTYRLTYEDVDEMLDLGCRRNQKSRSPLAQRRQGGGIPRGNQYPPAGGND